VADLAVLDLSQSTVASSALGDDAVLDAETTLDAVFSPGGSRWQVELVTDGGVGLIRRRLGSVRTVADAVEADA
jgi:hypothetical protein